MRLYWKYFRNVIPHSKNYIRPDFLSNLLWVQSVPEKWGYRISPDSTRILNRILPVTRLHIHVFYPCTLVYTCNSNLVPNTSAVYFISTYTKDFTVILRSLSRMRKRIAPGRVRRNRVIAQASDMKIVRCND